MTILAVDPGYERSGYVVYESGYPVTWAKVPNDHMRDVLVDTKADTFALEKIESYGMAVGATVFETCVWSGRFIEAWYKNHFTEVIRVARKEVKLHLCNSPRANDSTIRQALIDRYGPTKAAAIGLKATPGPLYGMKADCWAALAVAVTCAETRMERAA